MTALLHDIAPHPEAFTRAEVGWTPHLPPLAEEELTERHYDGLVDASRAKNDYFRLLARDPEVLKARTLVEAGWAKAEPLLDPSLARVMLRAFGWYVLERHY